jgi:hypothetical protein
MEMDGARWALIHAFAAFDATEAGPAECHALGVQRKGRASADALVAILALIARNAYFERIMDRKDNLPVRS